MCGDLMCIVNYGYIGIFSGDDIVIRMSLVVDGVD